MFEVTTTLRQNWRRVQTKIKANVYHYTQAIQAIGWLFLCLHNDEGKPARAPLWFTANGGKSPRQSPPRNFAACGKCVSGSHTPREGVITISYDAQDGDFVTTAPTLYHTTNEIVHDIFIQILQL